MARSIGTNPGLASYYSAMNDRAKRQLRFLAGFGVYFAAIWLLWSTPVVYPIKLFVVLLHEISHGIAALATGGQILGIDVTPREGGVCRCPGGSEFLTLSAGYLGSLLWGGAMIWSAERFTARGAWVTAGIAAVVGGATLLYVRQPFAAAFGLAFAAALIVVSRRAGQVGNRLVLTTLGLTSCLYAVLDIKSDVLDRPELLSDARMLAEITGIPTLAWGTIWIAIAIAFCIALFRWALRRV
ncbi:MAG: M50 family metallopeptidase [Gemmatimonadetes bacterium]|nr:M50 family metallopeptidase [Gemmatimonadota bacterium]